MSLFKLLQSSGRVLPAPLHQRLMNVYSKNVIMKLGDYQRLRRKRISEKDVRAVMDSVRSQHPSSHLGLLTDQEDLLLPFGSMATVVDCRSAVSEFDPKVADVFIYACESADFGMPYIRKIIGAKRKFFPVGVGSFDPARYLEEDHVAKAVLLDRYVQQTLQNFGKFSYGPGADFINLCQILERTKHVPGAYVEIGCYRGSSGQIAVKFMRDKKIFRPAVFIDVFEGFSYEEAKSSSDAMWQGTHQTEGIPTVRRRLEEFAHPEKGLTVDVRKANIISDDGLKDIAEIAVAYVDVDLYEAILVALQKVFPLVASGGAIVVEDAGHHPALIGARVALEEFLGSLDPKDYHLIQMESGQFIIFKR